MALVDVGIGEKRVAQMREREKKSIEREEERTVTQLQGKEIQQTGRRAGRQAGSQPGRQAGRQADQNTFWTKWDRFLERVKTKMLAS